MTLGRDSQEFEFELCEDHNSHSESVFSSPRFDIRREWSIGDAVHLQIDWGGRPIEYRKDILVRFLGATDAVYDVLTVANLASYNDTNENVVRKFDAAKLLFAAALRELNIASFDCRLIPRHGKYDMRIDVAKTQFSPIAIEL